MNADLVAMILSDEPHLVILADWLPMLTDDFLEPLTVAGVPAIYLHPALPEASDGGYATDLAFEAVKRGEI